MVKNYNGSPYVPRIYDITPASDGPATITLYVLQSELDAYNSYIAANSSGEPLLPTGPMDMTGMGNIVITQYHGSPNDTTTGPAGLYNAVMAQFIPNSSIAVNWNNTNEYWELTFPITGFSGFFIHSGNGPLNIRLKHISAVNAGKRNRVDWTPVNEREEDYYEVEHSTDGRRFSYTGTVTASGSSASYSFWDETPVTGINYYRLKMFDGTGKFTYSRVVTASVAEANLFRVEAWPNPVNDKLHVRLHGIPGNHARIHITDVAGKLVQTLQVTEKHIKVDMNTLAQGIYLVQYTDELHICTIRVSKE